MVNPVVEVQGLTKVFGQLKAVDDVSFNILPSVILSLQDPNGAGVLLHLGSFEKPVMSRKRVR